MGKNVKLVLLPFLVLLAVFLPALLFFFPVFFYLFLVLYSKAAPVRKPCYSSCFISLPSFRSPPC